MIEGLQRELVVSGLKDHQGPAVGKVTRNVEAVDLVSGGEDRMSGRQRA